MLAIDDNMNIKVSRHDTFSIRFCLEGYLLTEDDRFVFAIRPLDSGSEPLYEASFHNPGESYVDVVVPKGALDALEPGHYAYSVAVMNDATEQMMTCFFNRSFVVKEVACSV